MSFHPYLLSGSVLLMLWLPAHSAPPTEQLEPIVVTPTRTAQTADESLVPVTVIDRQTIEDSRASDIADLLRFHAGLDIGRTGGFGQQTSVFIRGAESNQTLVLVDGVRINSATTGGPALQNIRPEFIQRIEVVKGPRSALYGSEAIGGVINIITRRADAGFSGEVELGAGRYDSRRASGALSYGGDGFNAGINATRFDTDGFPTQETLDADAGHDNTTLNTFATTSVGIADLGFRLWNTQGSTEFGRDDSLDFQNQAASLELALTPVRSWTSTLRLSRTIDEIEQNQLSTPTSQERDFAETERFALDWQNDLNLGKANVLTAGVSVIQEDTEALSFGTGYDEDTTIRAAFAQDDLSLGRHDLVLAARLTDHEDFGQALTWNVDYGFALTTRTKLTAGIGTGFRAPDSNARFGFGGNPDLDPETSRNIELGLRQRFGDNQRFTIEVFDNKIDDLIETVQIAGSDTPFEFGDDNFRNRNVEEARIQGLELGYNAAIDPWSLDIEAIIQDPQNETEDSQLLRRAKRSLTGTIGYDTGAWSLGLDTLLTSEREDFGGETLGGYGLVNLHSDYAFAGGWDLAVKVENLFDKDYQLAAGFNTPGRSLFVELGYHYR